MARGIAFLFAVTVAMGSAIAALFVGNVFVAWGLGFAAGGVLVLANVLTHPMLFGWRE